MEMQTTGGHQDDHTDRHTELSCHQNSCNELTIHQHVENSHGDSSMSTRVGL